MVRRELRDYQKKCVDIATSSAINKGIFDLSCGSGKSIIMMEIASKYNISVICVPTKGLAFQFCKELGGCSDENRISGELKDRDRYVDEYFVFNSDRSEEDNRKLDELYKGKYSEDAKIVFIVNYQSLPQFKEYIQKSYRNGNVPIKIDVFLFDEAHKTTGTRSVRNARIELNGERAVDQDDKDGVIDFDEAAIDLSKFYDFIKDVKRFYFTATPNLIMKEKDEIYGKILFSLRYKQAISRKFLTPFEVVPIVADEVRLFSESPIRGNNRNEKYRNMLSLVKDNVEKYNLKRVIIYTTFAKRSDANRSALKTSIEDFEHEVQKNLDLTRGFRFKYFYSNTPVRERVNILNNWFDTNEEDVRIVVSCKTISEGIDVRQCDSIFLFDQDKSVNLTIQRAMRASRLPRQGLSKNKESLVFIPYLTSDPVHKNNKNFVIQREILRLLKEDVVAWDIEKYVDEKLKNMTERQLKDYIEKLIEQREDEYDAKEFQKELEKKREKKISIPDLKFSEKLYNKDKQQNWINILEEWVKVYGLVEPSSKQVIFLGDKKYNFGILFSNISTVKNRETRYKKVRIRARELFGSDVIPEIPVAKPKSPVAKPKSPVAKPKSPVAKPKSPVVSSVGGLSGLFSKMRVSNKNLSGKKRAKKQDKIELPKSLTPERRDYILSNIKIPVLVKKEIKEHNEKRGRK